MTARYAIKGTVSDVTECGQCGRADLRKTVALAPLDQDGGEGEVMYAGCCCAAKLLGTTGRAVSRMARNADVAREIEREHARMTLRVYAPMLELPVRERAAAYFARHPEQRTRGVSATATCEYLVARARQTLGTAA